MISPSLQLDSYEQPPKKPGSLLMVFDEDVFITSEGLSGSFDIFRCTYRREPLAEYYRARSSISIDMDCGEPSRYQDEFTDQETNNFHP